MKLIKSKNQKVESAGFWKDGCEYTICAQFKHGSSVILKLPVKGMTPERALEILRNKVGI